MTRRRPQPPIIRKAAKVASDLTHRLEDNAYFVAGESPWERDKDDESVKVALKNAKAFLDQIGRTIERPHISSGTTNNPDVILYFYWLHRRIPDGISGFSVSFDRNGKCSLSWDNQDGSSKHLEDISIKELLAMNIPSEINGWSKSLDEQKPNFNFG